MPRGLSGVVAITAGGDYSLALFVKVLDPATDGPTFLGITADATHVTARLEDFPGQIYLVEASSDLRHWVKYGQATASADGTVRAR